MSSKPARICSFIPVIIVSSGSKLEGNGDTDILISGSKLKKVKLPIYTDILIDNESIKFTPTPCPIDPYIKILHISRLHMSLNQLCYGYFHDGIKLETVSVARVVDTR